MLQITTHSPEQTHALAARVAPLFAPGDFVTLQGGLGSGKTVFVRGVLAGLGHRGKVNSPTYTLAAEYKLSHAGRELYIYHFDAYLAAKESQFLAEGGAELFSSGAICFVEWPEHVEGFLPADRLGICILEDGSQESRTLQFHATGARSAELLNLIKGILRDLENIEIYSSAGGARV